ncbi:unnamed protein product [Bursaphelenchus xylophilus]|uniref:(pine wood nematode) hypothetical protein n=1 Tax=Bursaphelenchus xylophilus TaxID=6326 RepID=A0A1I7S029_BURXY|nr:unnamed protein product [Bursaphelenchus xylophilus]CAG9109058.1 unnamed protein product [Bursaphelenchus xylophilus]
MFTLPKRDYYYSLVPDIGWPQDELPPMAPQDSIPKIVNYLFSHVVVIPNRLALKTLEGMCKRIQSDEQTRDTQLNNLINHVTLQNRLSSPCINVRKTRDGRIQVGGAKYHMSTVLIRLFCYPGVEKENLIESEEHSRIQGTNYICVNPDHYSVRDYSQPVYPVSVDYSIKKRPRFP